MPPYIVTFILGKINHSIRKVERLEGALLALGRQDLAHIAEMVSESANKTQTTIRIQQERCKYSRRQSCDGEMRFDYGVRVCGRNNRTDMLRVERSMHLLEGLHAALNVLEWEDLACIAEAARKEVWQVCTALQFGTESRQRIRKRAIFNDLKQLAAISGRPGVPIAIRLGRIVDKM